MPAAPTVHSPYTAWMAHHLNGEGRTRAKHGYICYAPDCPSNSAPYYPGIGATERKAIEAACYWTNQAPYVRVIPLSRAPQWAIDAAAEADHSPLW